MVNKIIIATFMICLGIGITITSIGPLSAASTEVNTMFPVKYHDFGIVPRYTTVSYSFPIVNRSKQALVIDRVSASCRCTRIAAFTPVVRPGQQGYIQIEVNTERLRGHKSATITVRITKPYPAVVELFNQVQTSFEP